MDWGYPGNIRFDVGVGGTFTYNINALTSAGQMLAQQAMDIWSFMTGLLFVQSSSAAAMIMFDDNQPGAFAGPTDGNFDTGILTQASVNVSTAWLAQYGTEVNSYSFLTYLHEIGHALGLGHAGPYDGSATYGIDNLYLNDSYLISIMSYFSLADNTFVNGGFGIPLTLMPADLAAIDRLYGLGDTAFGNTTWGANSNLTGLWGTLLGIGFDGDADPAGLLDGDRDVLWTLRDTGGIDTLDFSVSGDSLNINLTPGEVSDSGSGVPDMLIYIDTVIENFIGGYGGDTVTGNDADNNIQGRNGDDDLRGNRGADRLSGDAGNDLLWGAEGNDNLNGGTGDDQLYGGAGSDWLVTGAGNDFVYGGAGTDTLSYGDHARGVNVNLRTGQVTDSSGMIDFVDGVEGISGSRLADTITGDDGANRLRGNNGRDLFYATSGADTYDGGGSTDTLTYQTAYSGVAVNLTTGLGTEGIATGHVYVEIERVFGSEFEDSLTGSAGRDFLSGRDSDDLIFATAGADNYYGGDGDDAVGYGSATGGVEISLNQKTGAGNIADGHTLVSIEDVYGSSFADRLAGTRSDNVLFGAGGNDSLFGYEGNDFLVGGAGADFLFGGDGNDRLIGNAGADTLFGGAGVDTSVYEGNRADYTIAMAGSGFSIIHIGGTPIDGSDKVYLVELFAFEDVTLSAGMLV